MKMHELSPDPHFEALLNGHRDLIAKTLHRLEDGTGVPQLCYETLMSMSLLNGCIALILRQADDEAPKHFTASVQYALKMLTAPGVREDGISRSHEAHQEFWYEGKPLTVLHEMRPMAGSDKLSITAYHRALIAVVSFGEPSAFAQIVAVPEEHYRHPGTVAAEDYWQYLRAWRALLGGDEAGAKTEAEASLAKAKHAAPARQAFLALLQGDEAGFATGLDGELEAHKKRSAKQPNDPAGALCLPALALCRVALDRGVTVADRAYLSLRLLPNYRLTVH